MSEFYGWQDSRRCAAATKILPHRPPPPKRAIWEERARKALDSQAPSYESSVAATIEDAYRDGIKSAAAFVEEKGDRELAMLIRRFAEEIRSP